MIRAQLTGEEFEKITALQFVFANGVESPIFKPQNVEVTDLFNYTIDG